MIYFILYLIIGLALSFCFRTEDDNPAFFTTELAVLILAAWPVVAFVMATRITRLRWRGKILWEKKR